MPKQKTKDYNFSDLCEDIKRKLPANLHTTKEADNFMWIATKNYDIGSYPMHYEIRLDRGSVYAEVHYESDGIIAYKEEGEAHKVLQEEFVNYFEKEKHNTFCCVSKQSDIKCYKWYRLNGSGVKLTEKDCVKLVCDNVKKMVRITQKDLLSFMGKVFP